MLFKYLFRQLGVAVSRVEERPKGAAFLRVARESYPLTSLAYIALNVPVGSSAKRYIHCVYGDRSASHCITADPARLEDPDQERLFKEDTTWQDISESGLVDPTGDSPGLTCEGAAFPLPSSHGEQAAFVITANPKLGNWALEQQNIVRDFRVLAGYFHQHMLRIFGHDTDKDMIISAREIDCLKWMAAGKTAWEVSVILGISERTVRFHLNAAREKLNCTTTTQAVAKAVSQQIVVI